MIYDQGDGTRYYEIVLKWKRRCFYGIMEEEDGGERPLENSRGRMESLRTK